MRNAMLITAFLAALGGLCVVSDSAVAQDVQHHATPPMTPTVTPEQLIDSILAPHNSEITGQMVQQIIYRELGIPPHIFLSIIGAETSMGHRNPAGSIDPKIGGPLVAVHNYGCIKSGAVDTPWGRLADGTIRVAGKTWWTFPDPETGVRALGLALKHGPRSMPGYYMRCFRDNAGWQRPFALVWYGANVAGLEKYVDNLTRIDRLLITLARQRGILW